MVNKEEVIDSIKRTIPDAEVKVEDLGGGDHLQVSVISESFSGLSLVKQHQMVYAALRDKLANESIHALALSTSTRSN